MRSGGDRPLSADSSRSGGMADAEDSKSFVRKDVWVQIPPPAPHHKDPFSDTLSLTFRQQWLNGDNSTGTSLLVEK